MKVIEFINLFIGITKPIDSERIFEENLDMENRFWLSEDPKKFDFTIHDTEKRYNLFFNVRKTMNYPHYNLYVSFQLTDSLDNILFEDLINFELFDYLNCKEEI